MKVQKNNGEYFLASYKKPWKGPNMKNNRNWYPQESWNTLEIFFPKRGVL